MSAITIIVFLVLLGFGIWLLYSTRDLIRLGLSSYTWSSTEGTIVDSRDDSFTIPGIDRTSTGIVPVEYKETAHDYVYEVGGHMYRCSTFCFGGWAERAGAAYLIGTKVPVYYDPKHPEVAVLRRGLQFGAIFGAVPIAAALLWLFLTIRA
jgi:hypothetical protein